MRYYYRYCLAGDKLTDGSNATTASLRGAVGVNYYYYFDRYARRVAASAQRGGRVWYMVRRCLRVPHTRLLGPVVVVDVFRVRRA